MIYPNKKCTIVASVKYKLKTMRLKETLLFIALGQICSFKYISNWRIHRKSCMWTEDVSFDEDLSKFCTGTEKLQLKELFEYLSKSEYFLTNIWQKRPFLREIGLSSVVNAYRIEDVEKSTEKNFLEAGRGTFSDNKGGWNMVEVSKVK